MTYAHLGKQANFIGSYGIHRIFDFVIFSEIRCDFMRHLHPSFIIGIMMTIHI